MVSVSYTALHTSDHFRNSSPKIFTTSSSAEQISRNVTHRLFERNVTLPEKKVICDTKVFSQVKAKKVLHMKRQWLSFSIFTRGPQLKENLSQIVSQSGRQCVSRKSWWREEIERCCGKSRAVGRLPSLGDSCCSVASQEHNSETIRTHSSTRPTFSSSDDHNDNNDSMTIIMTMAMTAMTMAIKMTIDND